MDYADWRMAPPQIEQAAPGALSPWELKRNALVKALKAKNDPYWQQTWEGANTIETKEVDFTPWPNINGWVDCDKDKKHCTIFMNTNAADYGSTFEHEQTHAAGYDHPDKTPHIGRRVPFPWQPWK